MPQPVPTIATKPSVSGYVSTSDCQGEEREVNVGWWAQESTLHYPEALFDEENGHGTFYEGQALVTLGTGTDLT